MGFADFCKMEDAVCVLIEYLVDPKLPLKSFARVTPSQHNQESVAKQVHAVVILYNYYYRKQHPQLEVLGFESFCKLATIMRPTLLAYMKLMQLSSATELNDMEQQLSLTEKKIMDACNISSSLDASQNAPCIDGWPISKVSVFLMDSGRDFCWLKFGCATEGVWSVIEKDVNLLNNNSKGTTDSEQVERKRRHIRKPMKNVPGADEAMILHLAFSAVEETTGIEQSKLLVLEKHVVYSTSKEKAAACFYIMQCTEPQKSHLINHPIRDAIDSLQGPLIMRSSSQWFHTSVVEYFHLLPYASVLFDWASRNLSNSWQVKRVRVEITNANSSKRIEKPSVAEVPKSSRRQHIASRTQTGLIKQNEDNENYVVDHLHDDVVELEVDDCTSNHTKTTNKDTNVSNKVQTNNYQEQTTSVVRSLNGSANKVGAADSLKRNRITENGSITNQDCNAISSDENRMAIDSHALVQYDSNRHDLEEVYALLASKDRQLSQAALKVVLSKRAKLCLQLRDLEDQIALCDKNIQILNDGEGDLALKMQFLIEGCNEVSLGSLVQESVHQFSKDQCSTPFIRSKRSPDTRANNPCQELDDLCCRNYWILPRYCLLARDGGFEANVIVKGVDLEYSASGEMRSHPHEARESAAAQMLDKLRSRQGHCLSYK